MFIKYSPLLFLFFILKANGADLWPVDIAFEDLSLSTNKILDQAVTTPKLHPMNARVGEFLKYNGPTLGWGPTLIPVSQFYLGTWNASFNTPDLADPSVIAGDYYIISVPGTFNGVSFVVGDWIISDGYNWQKVAYSQTNLLSFSGRKGIVSLTPVDYVSLKDTVTQKITGSKLSDIADINSTSLSDGQVLKWNVATSSWLPSNDENSPLGIILSSLSASTPLNYNASNGMMGIAAATQSSAGTLSSADKTKLDGLVAIPASGDGTVGRFSGILMMKTCSDGETLIWNEGSWTCTTSLILSGATTQVMGMARNTASDTAGNNLSVSASGATNSSTDKAGGNLVLRSGAATGTGSSSIQLMTSTSGISGTTDHTSNSMMTISGGGNIGIGSTIPVSKIHTYENNVLTGDSNGVTIEQSGSGDTLFHFLLSVVQRWSMGINNFDGDKFKIGTSSDLGSSNVLTLLNSGEVGIGTSVPTSLLHTVASGGQITPFSGNLFTSNATSSTASIRKSGLELKSTGAWSGSNSANTGLYISQTTGGTNNYDALFNGGGKVGIGTTNPTSPLVVISSSSGIKGSASLGNNDKFTLSSSSGHTSLNWFAKSDESSGYLTTDASAISSQISESSSNEIKFSVASSNAGIATAVTYLERMRIQNNGYLGIGTTGTTPNALMTVYGGGWQSSIDGSVVVQKDLAQYRTGVLTTTGTLKISLPVSWDNNLSVITVRGYNYTPTTGSWEVIIGGFSDLSGSQWSHVSTQINGRPPFTSVRLGFDGSKTVILLGNTATVTSYFVANVAEVISSKGTPMPTTGWAISQITDESGITGIVNSPVVSWLTNGSNLNYTAGNIGIGTSSPMARTHINYGNTPATAAETLRLDVTGNASTDRGPYLSFFAPNGLNVSKESAQIVGSTTSVDGGGAMIFRTSLSGTATTPLEKVRLTASGTLGVGVSATTSNLDVVSNTAITTDIKIQNSSGAADGEGARLILYTTGLNADSTSLYRVNNGAGSSYYWAEGVDGSDSRRFKLSPNTINVNGAPKITLTTAGSFGVGTSSPAYKFELIGGEINASGNVRAATITLTSDRRWKKKVKPLNNSIEKIMHLNGVSYDWAVTNYPEKYFSKNKQIGLIAQEVQQIFPELVSADASGFLSIHYSGLLAPLIEAFKSQQQQIEANTLLFKTMKDEYKGLESKILENKRKIASFKAESKSEFKSLERDSQGLKNDLADIKSGICQLKPKLKICLWTKFE